MSINSMENFFVTVNGVVMIFSTLAFAAIEPDDDYYDANGFGEQVSLLLLVCVLLN